MPFEKGKSGSPENQFSSENQPSNSGRKKKIYTILKELGYSKDDMRSAFHEMAWYTLSDLQEVHQDDSKPVIVRIVANQFFLALKNGDMGKIKEIMEQTLGKPKQEIDQKNIHDFKEPKWEIDDFEKKDEDS